MEWTLYPLWRNAFHKYSHILFRNISHKKDIYLNVFLLHSVFYIFVYKFLFLSCVNDLPTNALCSFCCNSALSAELLLYEPSSAPWGQMTYFYIWIWISTNSQEVAETLRLFSSIVYALQQVVREPWAGSSSACTRSILKWKDRFLLFLTENWNWFIVLIPLSFSQCEIS